MTRFGLVAITSLLLAGSTFAGEIELRKKFFGGWQFTSDAGMSWTKIGVTGSALREAMSGNDSARTEMDRFKTNNTVAVVTSIPAGFLIGWPLGSYVASGDWKDSYTTMYYIGVPLAVVSTIFEITAKGHLKRAVRIYNGEEQALQLKVTVQRPYASTDSGTLMLGVAWRF
jgi:hypothetical protein